MRAYSFDLAVLWLSLAMLANSSLAASPIVDRDTLCSLKYGLRAQVKGKKTEYQYVGSTPMEDACRSSHKPSRIKICEFHYLKSEIVEACVDTYDAVTEQIRQAKQ